MTVPSPSVPCTKRTREELSPPSANASPVGDVDGKKCDGACTQRNTRGVSETSTTTTTTRCPACPWSTAFRFCPHTGEPHVGYIPPSTSRAAPSNSNKQNAPQLHHFVPGDIVWCKVETKGIPMWPAEVLVASPSGEETENAPSPTNTTLTVRFVPPTAGVVPITCRVPHTSLVYFDHIPCTQPSEDGTPSTSTPRIPHLDELIEQRLARNRFPVEAFEREYVEAVYAANAMTRIILDPTRYVSLTPPMVCPAVGIVYSSFRAQYSAPRQPNVLQQPHDAIIVLRKGLDNICRDLDGIERIWVLFHFNYGVGLHRSRYAKRDGTVQGFKPMVIPPRDTQPRGVFATRSPHRPNAIGLSCVELVRVVGQRLFIRDHDLLHGTPVLDIKPYLAFCDAYPAARAGWVDALNASGKAKPTDHRWNKLEFSVHRADKDSHEKAVVQACSGKEHLPSSQRWKPAA